MATKGWRQLKADEKLWVPLTVTQVALLLQVAESACSLTASDAQDIAKALRGSVDKATQAPTPGRLKVACGKLQEVVGTMNVATLYGDEAEALLVRLGLLGRAS